MCTQDTIKSHNQIKFIAFCYVFLTWTKNSHFHASSQRLNWLFQHSVFISKDKTKKQLSHVCYFVFNDRLIAASWFLINSRYFSDLMNFSYSFCIFSSYDWNIKFSLPIQLHFSFHCFDIWSSKWILFEDTSSLLLNP